ncbi:MAG: OB-fold nucleic acid binding domain-containing protein, partial [Planctomycetota bacterium]|nr:OB-fold nucleic acid binding domain-containing protein [Planctomycetota bacterium]
PISEAGERITRYTTHTHAQLADSEEGDEVMLGGMVGAIKKAQTKKPSRNGHTRYVNFDFEDETGIVRCIMWPEEFSRQGELIVPEAILYLRGKVDRRGREPNVVVNKLMTLDDADKEFTKQLAIRFQRGLHAESEL